MSQQVTKKSIKLGNFLVYANAFFLTIGMPVYELNIFENCSLGPSLWNALLRVYFTLQMLNLNGVLISELIYVFLAIAGGTNFLEATMNLSFIGFVIIGELKIWLMWRQRADLRGVVQQFKQLHPTTLEQQSSYHITQYFRTYQRISIFYFSLHVLLIWAYNLNWALNYLVTEFWLGHHSFKRMLPYYSWLPWDWSTNWSYYVLYVSQSLAAQACLSGQLSVDLLMCALVTLLVMHFRHLGQDIEQYVAQVGNSRSDLEFLQSTVAYHQRVLQLSEDVNRIFGVSLLCNFTASSFIICLVGFHLTVGGKLDNLILLIFFLFCALLQIFMISNYAQRLLDASERIGQAVYNHDWSQAELSYRQMMRLIIQRSQKPSRLMATNFLSVSLASMTALLQLSYKFFALLRTMYVK